MKTEPKFKITKRNGKFALWVNMGSNWQNIWDLNKNEATPNVLKAIMNAVGIGEMRMEAYLRTAINHNTDRISSFNDTWMEVL
jgi:hypothetical protein